MNDDEIQKVRTLLRIGNFEQILKLAKEGLDLRAHHDYLLYLACFDECRPAQEFLIRCGLDPELTLGRLKHAHDQELQYVREYKKATDEKKSLEASLKPNDTTDKKITPSKI